MKKMNFETFVERSRLVHGDKYIYHEEFFYGSDKKTLITCPIHGDFWQKPYKHINNKQGCPRCAGKGKTTKEIIEEFKEKWGNKWIYNKSEYIGNHKKLCVICPKHGEFWITPANHLNGKGCPKCKQEKLSIFFRKSNEQFINEALQKHDGKYDLSKVEYVNNHTKVCIICHEKDENGIEHGEFWQTPQNHLYGEGCPKCIAKKMHNIFAKTTEEFKQQERIVHGNRYILDKVNYVDNKTKVEIVCPIHGSFWQLPNSHLIGRGCPLCNESHLEKEVEDHINEIKHIRNKRFEWLGGKSLDFYIPQYSIAIECQGIQHFRKSDFFDKHDPFENRLNRDIRKKQLCEEHGVKLYYFSHENFDEFLDEKVYHNIDELIKEIKKTP